MSGLGDMYKKVPNAIKRIFYGSKIFDSKDKKLFDLKNIKNTRYRTQFFLILIIIIQLFNIIANKTAGAHHGFAYIFCRGSVSLIAVCVVFLGLFFIIERTPATKLSTDIMCLRLCWILLLTGSLFFTYGDMAESRTVSNFTMFALAVGIMPLFNPVDKIIMLAAYLAVNIGIGVSLGMGSIMYQQMAVSCIISVYFGCSQFLSSAEVFFERRQLEKTNILLEKLSETDKLTGLSNRLGMEKKLRIIGNPERKTEADDSLCLIMIDIDFFKNYNDKFMHLEGDRCLERIAKCLKDCSRRSTDIAARYGGEEFVMTVKNMKEEDLIAYAVKIREAVEGLKIPFGYNDETPFVTVSIGAARRKIKNVFNCEEEFSALLLEEADEQLYNAKANGKNCVSFKGKIYK